MLNVRRLHRIFLGLGKTEKNFLIAECIKKTKEHLGKGSQFLTNEKPEILPKISFYILGLWQPPQKRHFSVKFDEESEFYSFESEK